MKKKTCLKDLENYSKGDFTDLKSKSFHGFACPGPPGGYSHTLPIRVCAAQRGRDFEAPDLERRIHFRGIF